MTTQHSPPKHSPQRLSEAFSALQGFAEERVQEARATRNAHPLSPRAHADLMVLRQIAKLLAALTAFFADLIPPPQPATHPATTTPGPITAHPITAHPIIAHPITARPITARPITARPITAHPNTAHPNTAYPAQRVTRRRAADPQIHPSRRRPAPATTHRQPTPALQPSAGAAPTQIPSHRARHQPRPAA